MKDSVAERVLANVMDWDADELNELGARLQLLAAHKYDSYEGYRPGVKFLESLTAWLHQFDTPEDRRAAVDFVLNDLIFISRAELAHLIETVYPHHIRPMLIERAAERLGVSRFAVKRIVESDEFRQIQRRTLVLGLSDGAHIDQLRRASPHLSHEQIFLATDIGDEAIRGAVEKLREATADSNARFEHVLLVDDFYGSGKTLLRQGEDGSPAGRLWRTNERLKQLVEGLESPDSEGQRLSALAPDFKVSTLVYLASAQAIEYVEEILPKVGLTWDFRVVQPFPETIRVTDQQIKTLCEWHYDRALTDRHKGKDTPFGYSDCALPLVLQHNTPNNSICILWADSTDRPSSLERRALFPRYERHREDRK
jgi:hypothetical protein